MEYIEIKTEDGLYENYEISKDSVETSDCIFGNPHQQALVDGDGLDESPFFGESLDKRPRVTWLPKDCKLLISLYKEEYPNQGKSYEMKTRRNLFERIAKRMRERGSNFTVSQVETKWKNLKRAYIITRTESRPYPYEKDLSDVMPTQPQSTPQTSGTEGSGKAHEQLLTGRVSSDAEARSADVSVGNESPAPQEVAWSDDTEEERVIRKKRKGRKIRPPTIARELQKWRVEFARERRANKEYRTAKLKAYEKRTSLLVQQIKQRQELLDALMGSKNKLVNEYK